MMKSFLSIFQLILMNFAYGKPDGAPFDSCIQLTPRHGQTPTQPLNTNPFQIKAEKIIYSVDQNEAVKVSVSSDKMDKFTGFIVQARYANNPEILIDGSFFPENQEHSKIYTCKPGEKIMNNNTWTHNENSSKETVTAIWIPPADFKEAIIFAATVVKDKKTFWEGIKSDKIMIDMNVSVKGASSSLWIKTPQVVSITNKRRVSQEQTNDRGTIGMEDRSAAHKMGDGKISDDYKQDKNDVSVKHYGDKGMSDGYSGDEKGYQGSAKSFTTTSVIAMIIIMLSIIYLH